MAQNLNTAINVRVPLKDGQFFDHIGN